MTTQTVLIVPAVTDQAGQCRIVARDGKVSNALSDYRRDDKPWKEVGLMNSRGVLVNLAPYLGLWDEMKSCEPLSAGLQFTTEPASA